MMLPLRLLTCLLAASAAGLAAPALAKLTVQLDWVAEPEHGGIYQAAARGFFREEGLDVTIIPGGPGAHVMSSLATGKADIAQAGDIETLLKQAEGLPFVQFAAVFQDDPAGILVHADSTVRKFEDLNGRTIIARPSWPFLDFLRRRFNVKVNVVAQNFSTAAFLNDKEALQQGYYIAEPYHITKAGGKMPRFLSTWDAGFRGYAVLVTNRTVARTQPERLRAFTRAYIRGWRDYLEGDPTPAHQAMKQANANNTDEFMAFSRQMIIRERLVTGRDADGGPAKVGRLETARFATQIALLEELGLLAKGKLTAEAAMTTAFLP
jgi:NitT/TauT family transport system substrate-binding protein